MSKKNSLQEKARRREEREAKDADGRPQMISFANRSQRRGNK